jgi:HAD superfamily hydrolase (TIGR01509 family)
VSAPGPFAVGVDTSHYTTSVCAVDGCGSIAFEARRPLAVPAGERGLMQSAALFQHVAGLPALLEELRNALAGRGFPGRIARVGVSDRPRAADGSYMPVFHAGVLAAAAMAAASGAELIRTTHQAGHVAAGLATAGLPAEAGAAVLAEHDRRPEGLWCVPDRDAEPVLRELARRGLRLGVVSNADGRVRAQLERAGLAPFFAVIIDSAEVGVSKPDPAIFRMAAARLGVAPAEAVYVGDIYQVDVAGARAAGMRGLWLAPAGVPGGDFPERIERLSDILITQDFGGA